VLNHYATFCQKNSIFLTKTKYFFDLSKKRLHFLSYDAGRQFFVSFSDFALISSLFPLFFFKKKSTFSPLKKKEKKDKFVLQLNKYQSNNN
jgi:hypothetical protein